MPPSVFYQRNNNDDSNIIDIFDTKNHINIKHILINITINANKFIVI